MKKLFLFITLAFFGFSIVNAQQIDLGDPANSSRCGASIIGNGSGSTGSGFIQCNNCSEESGFIVQADKDFDKIRFRYAANSNSGGVDLDGVYKITLHNDNDCSSSFPVGGTSYTFPHTGGWSIWEEITLNVSGSEGEYIHVRPDSPTGGINPDWIEFVTTLDLGDPANSKTCGNSVIATNASGYTGLGFRANNNDTENSGFIVQADKDFDKIRFRYAAATTSSGTPLNGVYNISVQTHDDCNTGGPDFTFPHTGGWSTWEEVTFDISGNQGDYLHLRRGAATGGVNPDWIEFVASEEEPLPIEFLGMQYECLGQYGAVLTWQTASEVNAQYFEVMRSDDGFNWNKTGEVAANGTTNQLSEYEFYDKSRSKSGVSYYRLKQIDFDGQFKYLPIISTRCVGRNKATLYPNPASDRFFIELKSASPQKTTIRIADSYGRIVATQNVLLHEGVNVIPWSTSGLAMGVYFLYTDLDFEGVNPMKILIKN